MVKNQIKLNPNIWFGSVLKAISSKTSFFLKKAVQV